MKRPPSAAALQRQVDRWNATVPVGAAVDYFSHPGARPQRYTTREPASILSGHTAVTWLDGKGGCVSLDSLKPANATEAA